MRAFLGKNAAKKGSLSRFIEEAVLQRLRFEETVKPVQDRNASVPPEEIENAIDEAIHKTRRMNIDDP